MDKLTNHREEDREDPLLQVTAVWQSLRGAAALAGLTDADEATREPAEDYRAA